MTESRKRFLINLLLGFCVAMTVITVKWDAESLLSHKLCDGSFVAAVMLMGFGGLKFARNGGTFDIMAWGIGSAVRMTFPWLLNERKDADFAAYKERKKDTRQSAKPELLSGLVYLALCLIFLVIYLAQV